MTTAYDTPGTTCPAELATRPSQSAPPQHLTADPEPALARWENEGGGPARTPPSPSRPDNVISRESGPRNPLASSDIVANDSPTSPGTGDKDGLTRRSHVRVGRVYDQRGSRDHLRVLVDRLWPRGLSKARADIDEWCKQVAPSTALRTWYGHDPDDSLSSSVATARNSTIPTAALRWGTSAS